MDKKEIETLIRKYLRTNYFQEPSCFDDFAINGIKITKTLAKGFWDHRTDEEIYRDERAGVTLGDYQQWTLNELYILKTTDQEN